MPQFDTFSFFSQLFWVFFIFFIFYFSICFFILPSLASTLKTRNLFLANYNGSSSIVSLGSKSQTALDGSSQLIDNLITLNYSGYDNIFLRINGNSKNSLKDFYSF
jgi:hypothetical protein